MFIVLIDLLNIDFGHGNIASNKINIIKYGKKIQNCSFKKRKNFILSLLFNDEKNSKVNECSLLFVSLEKCINSFHKLLNAVWKLIKKIFIIILGIIYIIYTLSAL